MLTVYCLLSALNIPAKLKSAYPCRSAKQPRMTHMERLHETDQLLNGTPVFLVQQACSPHYRGLFMKG